DGLPLGAALAGLEEVLDAGGLGGVGLTARGGVEGEGVPVERLFQVALVLVDIGEEGVSGSILRVEAERLGAEGGRLVPATTHAEQVGAREEGIGGRGGTRGRVGRRRAGRA